MLIHVVRPGEVLWQIAAYYRVPVNDIVEINELPNPNQLLIGQALVIPTEDIIYSVNPNDTLWEIAQKYNTTVQSIMQANNISDPNYIYPGQNLLIPAPRYIVQPNDTLWKISQKYDVSLERLIRINQIENPYLIYPGTELIIPGKKRTSIEVNGYIYFFGEPAAPIIREVGQYLTYMSPFAYLIRENGTLVPIDDSPAIQAAYDINAVPMMSITNFTTTELGENLAHIILANPEIQEMLLTNILRIMRDKGYQGLNIDFENVLPDDRELYNAFIARAADVMDAQGYFISSALAPKVSAQQAGLLYTAHDYEAHGRIMDFVILMTYEWGYRKGPPRPISPINEIRRVLDYAVSVMPRDKIFFGFQIYARDWVLPFVAGQEAETFSPQEAIRRAVYYGTVIQYDPISQSPYFRYYDENGRLHEVWFEDARSAQAKFETVKAYDLRGISYWALGYPYPQNWVLLEDNFNIIKLL